MRDHFIAFWNVENLFAPEGNPGRLDWLADRLAADLAGWTPELYATKLRQLASVVGEMNDRTGPDVLGVCEIEDAGVLADLAEALREVLPARRYGVVHADNTRDRRGIDTAFFFDTARYTVDPSLIFNHWVMRRTGTRDILQATFRTDAGHDLVLLCNHWPSRKGGAIASAGFRATAGETLGYWHERIRAEAGVDTAVIAMGDFNDDPFDPSLRFNAVAWRERGDVARADSARFLNLAWEYLTFEAVDRRGNLRVLDGTLYFDDDGNVFDQMLVGPSLLNGRSPFSLIDGSAGVIAPPRMVDHRVGRGPVRFGLPRGDAARNVDPDGFSDHFPVSLRVRER